MAEVILGAVELSGGPVGSAREVFNDSIRLLVAPQPKERISFTRMPARDRTVGLGRLLEAAL